jgi:tRNA threonylcarbamoyladenosine biosynthesis protein TsaB
MNILAFDTCLGACSVAVAVEAGGALEKVESLFDPMITGQAERLMPMIDIAMRTAGIGFADLNRIAVTIGPGTFTGTRIGVAAARAFALATGASVVGLSTLQLMAEEATRRLDHGVARRLVITVDAHRGQVYAQVFSIPSAAAVSAPQLLSMAEAAALARDEAAVFAGSGAQAVAAEATAAGYMAEAMLPGLQPNAAYLLLAAQNSEPADAPLRPLYLRPADAKPQTGKSMARITTP